MKKMLLTLATVGALAVPFGVALADDAVDPVEPVPTSSQHERTRERDRHHADDTNPAQEHAQEQDRDGDGTQAHAREQKRLQREDCDGAMARVREQHRLDGQRADS